MFIIICLHRPIHFVVVDNSTGLRSELTCITLNPHFVKHHIDIQNVSLLRLVLCAVMVDHHTGMCAGSNIVVAMFALVCHAK